MSNLADISIDKIDTDVMSVLYANIDTTFSQYSLFNKLLSDKYDGQYTNTIHPNFKSKFLLVLRNLMSTYDDIKITKENGIYHVVCTSGTEKPIEFNKIKTNINIENPLVLNDFAYMYDYIYDNNLKEYMNWSDPFDGNSIFHELVLSGNKNQIIKLMSLDQFNFFVKNNHGQTPIDLVNNQETSNIILTGLCKKLINLTNEFEIDRKNNKEEKSIMQKKLIYYESNDYKNKIIDETSFYQFVRFKLSKYYQFNRMYIFSGIVCYMAIKYLF